MSVKVISMLERGLVEDFIAEFCDGSDILSNVVECVSKYSVYDIAQYIWEFSSEDKDKDLHVDYAVALTLAIRMLGVINNLMYNADVYSEKSVFDDLEKGIKIAFTTL